MAKKCSIERNKKREKMNARLREKRESLRATVKDLSLPLEERFAAVVKLSELPRNSSRVRIHNRCQLTGRPRGTYRKFKLARIVFRDMANRGQVPGVVKASW